MTGVVLTVRTRAMMEPVATRLARVLSAQADLPFDRVEQAAAVCAETIDQANPTQLTVGFAVDRGTLGMTFTGDDQLHLRSHRLSASDADAASRS